MDPCWLLMCFSSSCDRTSALPTSKRLPFALVIWYTMLVILKLVLATIKATQKIIIDPQGIVFFAPYMGVLSFNDTVS